MAVCRIKDDHQIAAESRHNFHFLSHFNSKVAGLMFNKFYTM